MQDWYCTDFALFCISL